VRVSHEYPVCAVLERDLRASQALGQVPVALLVSDPEDADSIEVIFHMEAVDGEGIRGGRSGRVH
jgi:proteasome lid subunit RPN8/RPN11